MDMQTPSETASTAMLGARDGIINAYREHQDLLIFALTGRTGSGCTTAADLLTTAYQPLLANHYAPEGPEARKHQIIKNFCEKNWNRPFSRITVSSLLVTFLLQESKSSIDTFNDNLNESKLPQPVMVQLHQYLQSNRAQIQPLMDVLGLERHALATYDWANADHLLTIINTTLLASLKSLRRILGANYTIFMQDVGDNIRKSGTACDPSPDPSKLFTLPQRIVKIIECIRDIDKQSGDPNRHTRIVIDAIRNPLELVYIRDRYSPLYAVAITANDVDRSARLGLNLTADAVKKIDEREYPDKHKPLSTYASLITQDIPSCLQKADIFIANPGKPKRTAAALRTATSPLYAQLMKYYATALQPGLVTPTRDERCMQVAFTAKANSGCISRQVGAVVTDRGYGVKAIGWNDVPRGQVPCALRNVDGLIAATDEDAYSTFEREDDELRTYIEGQHVSRTALASEGLPCSFCFKDAVNKSGRLNRDRKPSDNQVHTRSLHAEENAFLQLTSGGGAGIEGGKLFTTASPCELCSKKAFQLGIKDIVYIDPYPGISISHVISSGSEGMRPSVRLFSGSVGKAYHRLYEPMLPVKDEIIARLAR